MGFQIVNVAGGRFDKPFMPTKKNPYTKGIRVEMANGQPIAEHTYTLTTDAELISIAIAASRYEDRDFWNFYVNDKIIMDEIYTKELPEGLYLMVVVPVKKGDKLKFEFENRTMTQKSVWLNYQMLR